MINFFDVDYHYPEDNHYIFRDFSLNIPEGITSLVGQNGTGKTTMLLLAGGLLIPEKGNVKILDKDTNTLTSSHARQELVSFIYQNMDFETEESIQTLLHQVLSNGFHVNKDELIIRELIDVCELGTILDRRTQDVSKGELQRVIIAFSILYGSKILIMDEPFFALESYQKKKIMNYLKEYSKNNNVPVIFSAHELDLSATYSENVIFFYKNRLPEIGLTGEIFTEKNIEEVYGIPFAMLKQKEHLYRESLMHN